MPTKYTEQLPVALTAYRSSIDGAIVVEIDQEESAADQQIRVLLNDGLLYSGFTDLVSALDPEKGRDHARHLEKALEVADIKEWEQSNLLLAIRTVITFLKGGDES